MAITLGIVIMALVIYDKLVKPRVNKGG